MAFSTITADDIVKEYLLFRGFVGSVRALDVEMKQDKDRGLSVENLVNQIFTFISNFELDEFLVFWDQLNRRFISKADQDFSNSARKLEVSLKRLYLINCVRMRPDKVSSFFENLSSNDSNVADWQEWWVLPFTKSPETHPSFEPFFALSWLDALKVSLFNFLSSVLHAIPLPTLLHIQKPKSTVPPHAVLSRPTSMVVTEFSARKQDEPLTTPRFSLPPDAPAQDEPASSSVQASPPHDMPSRVSPQPAPVGDSDTTILANDADSKTAPFEEGVNAGQYSGHSSMVVMVAVSPRAAFAASLDTSNILHVWSCAPNRIVPRQRVPFGDNTATCIVWVAERFVAVGHGSGALSFIETHQITQDDVVRLPNARDIKAIACDAEGHVVACCAVEAVDERPRGMLALVDVATRKATSCTAVTEEGVALLCVRFNATSKLLVAGASSGVVVVTDGSTGHVLQKYTIHRSRVLDARLCLYDSILITLGDDGLVLRTPLDARRRSVVQLDTLVDVPTRLPGLCRLVLDDNCEHALVYSDQGETDSLVEMHTLRGADHSACDVDVVVRGVRVTALDWCSSKNLCVCAMEDGPVFSYALDLR